MLWQVILGVRGYPPARFQTTGKTRLEAAVAALDHCTGIWHRLPAAFYVRVQELGS